MEWRTTATVLLVSFCIASVILGSEAQTSPIFSEVVYNVSVPETFVERGYLRPEDGFLHVGCLDPGTGEGRNVTYFITETDPGPFLVDNATGSLSVTADLDYETETFYIFHVRCRDINFPSLTDTTTVVIIIDSVNEYLPDVRVSSISGTTFVPENQAIGTVIASSDSFPDPTSPVTYTVTDMDSGPHGIESVRYTLSETEGNSENAQSFTLNFTTGTLVLSGSLDVDNASSSFETINLRLTPCDVQPPLEQCPNLQVTILVISANDNFPQFSQDTYELSVPETTPVNSTLDLVLVCTDADRGAGEFEGIELKNSTLSLIWDVDITQGTITLREQLDFEVSDRHEFVVRCFDTGGLEDNASVVINVISVNDNRPQFDASAIGQNGEATYRFTVDRIDTSDGYVVGQIQAIDNDAGVGNEITYSIEGDSNFDINSATGEITLTDFIFAFEGSSFTLTVTASDGEFNTTATVDVKVTGLLSIPELILVGVGGFIFLVLVLLIFICICYCHYKLRKRKPYKKRKTDSQQDLHEFVDHIPRPLMIDPGHGPVYMVGAVPSVLMPSSEWEEGYAESIMTSLDEPDLSTVPSNYRIHPQMGPVLKEMVEIFHDGDKVLQKKK